MRRIVHISDMHFGKHIPEVVEALIADVHAQQPDLLAISGDMTQRARHAQFRAARDALQRLPQPQLVVPGNHDVPLYDVSRRFLSPLRRYRHYIARDLMPYHADAEVAVHGVNTARSWTISGGRVSYWQMALLRRRLCPLPPEVFRVVVTHHEFVPPPGVSLNKVVGRAPQALEILEDCGVDLLLAGHLHKGYNADVTAHYPARTRSMVVAQAGTATSHRLRDETNSYNVIAIEPDAFTIVVRSYVDGAFTTTDHSAFTRRDDGGWQRHDAA